MATVRIFAVLGAVVAAVLAWSPAARAENGLTAAEHEELLHGTTIVRPQRLERGGKRYVGGVSYAVVDARPDQVAYLISDVGAWRRILPKTRAAQVVGVSGGDQLVEITHGNAIVQASYTLRVRRNDNGMRFWVDPGHRHDIEDAWGYLRLEPLPNGQTVVVYGILVDMGPGMMRDMFEDRVRDLALSVPDRVRGLVVAQNAAGRRASR
jgi:hypothetical protein